MDNNGVKYTMTLTFEPVYLPPVNDVLIIGKDSTQSKHGVSKSLDLLAPDNFKLFELQDDLVVEAIIVKTAILQRIPAEKLIEILRKNVFPYISSNELIKVDLNMKITCSNLEGDL